MSRSTLHPIMAIVPDGTPKYQQCWPHRPRANRVLVPIAIGLSYGAVLPRCPMFRHAGNPNRYRYVPTNPHADRSSTAPMDQLVCPGTNTMLKTARPARRAIGAARAFDGGDVGSPFGQIEIYASADDTAGVDDYAGHNNSIEWPWMLTVFLIMGFCP